MMTIKLIAVGSLGADYYRQAAAEYQKRLGAYCRLIITEIPEHKLPQSPSPAQIEAGLKKEGRAILQAMSGSHAVALCVGGRRMSSEGLADLIGRTALYQTSTMAFIIGSSYGLSDEVEAAAQTRLSLSDMTLPHELCRVVLLEQLYRAFSINAGGKYHK